MIYGSFKSFLVLLFAAIVVCSVVISSPAIAQKLPQKIAGVRIVGEGYGKTDFGAELRAFNWPKGTTVALLVQNKAGGLIEVIEDQSTVTKMVDDKGTNLLSEKSKFSDSAFSFSGSDISKDGKVAMFEISTVSLPAKGATSIKLQGEVHIASGSKSSTSKSESVKAKKGENFEVGGLKFSIKAAGKPKWGESQFSLELSYKDEAGNIKDIKVYSVDGKELETEVLGTMAYDMGNGSVVSKTIGLDQKVDAMIVGVESWTDRKVIKVPLNLDVTLGM